VGDGAKIGSNAVVIKPVPAGATAVGIPARIIPSKEGASADVTEPWICRPWFSRPVRHRRPPLTPTARARSGFTAYGVTQEDDPLAQAMRGLVDGAACHEEQLAKLWEVVEKLSVQMSARDCVPSEAERGQHFETEKIKQILGK
jgi:serine O-acetyltransferase